MSVNKESVYWSEGTIAAEDLAAAEEAAVEKRMDLCNSTTATGKRQRNSARYYYGALSLFLLLILVIGAVLLIQKLKSAGKSFAWVIFVVTILGLLLLSASLIYFFYPQKC